jgi:protein TonB
VVGFLIFGSMSASAVVVAREVEEDVMEVQLATEPEPEPEPEPLQLEPEQKPKLQRLRDPTEIPDDAPAEKDPTGDPGGDDPYANYTQSETVQAPVKAVVEAPPPPKPKPVAPPRPKIMRVTEDVAAPVPVSQAQPSYPDDARARGIEGTVVVKYVVDETGKVSAAKVVRGPQELHAACLAAMKTWRFQPATLDGKPVSVYRVARFPFHLKT